MPPNDFVLGIDVSRHQGTMDWDKAYSAGARFSMIRAGSIAQVDGSLYTDDQFERNAEEAPQRLPVGFYFYFRPQFDPLKQAGYFANLIKDKDNRLRPAIDVETEGGQAPATIAARVLTFLDIVETIVKIKPKVYTRMSFWNPYVARHGRWKEFDLWVARYANLTNPWSDGNYEPIDWGLDDWDFWQYSADGNGRGQEFGAPPYPAASWDMDIDCFNGNIEAFNKYLAKIQPAPPVPEGKTMIVSDLKSIKAVGGTSTIEFTVPPGEEWFIEAAHLYMQRPCAFARIGVKDINANSVFLESMSAEAWHAYLITVAGVTLIPGERLYAVVDGAPSGSTLSFGFRGVKSLIQP